MSSKYNKNVDLSWYDIDYETKCAIDNVINADLGEELKIKAFIDILFGININEIPYTRIPYYIDQLKFLSDKIPVEDIKKTYTINGRVYKMTTNINKLTAGQYLDYMNYLKMTPIEYNKLLSTLLIPEGHKYLDGYEIEVVHDDLMKINVVDLNSISNFLMRQSLKYIKHSVNSSILTIWRTKSLTLKQKARLTRMAGKATKLMEHSIIS